MLDFIARHAICPQDRNATALMWAVAFWAAARAPVVLLDGESDRQLGQCLNVAACAHAGQIEVVLAVRQRRLESP